MEPAVIDKLPLDFAKVLVSEAVTVVFGLVEGLRIKEIALEAMGVGRFRVALEITIGARLDNRVAESEAEVERRDVLFCDPEDVDGRLVVEKADLVDTAVELVAKLVFEVKGTYHWQARKGKHGQRLSSRNDGTCI